MDSIENRMNVEKEIVFMDDNVEDENRESVRNDATECCELNTLDDNDSCMSKKQCTLWSNEATVALLKLYANKLKKMVSPKKKTQIWTAISESLREFNVEVTPDQVLWKINALTRQYKEYMDLGEHETFQYFKEMDNIYSQIHVDNDANTIGELLNFKNDTCNSQFKLGSNKVLLKPHKESKAVIRLRKIRLANRIESDRSKSKLHLEKHWLEYLKSKEEQKVLRDEVIERNLKLKEEELEVHKKSLDIKESLEYRKMQMWERKHETLLSIEREKFEMLKKMLSLNK